MKKAKSKSAKKPKAAVAPKVPSVPRAVVQIVSGPGNEIILLCNDGTVWMGGPGSWRQVNIDQVLIEVVPAATLALEAAHRRIDTLSGELADAKAKKE